MGILIITWNFPPRRGGIERIMARLYAGLKTSHSVQLITTSGTSSDGEVGVFRSPVRGLLPFFLYALWRGTRSLGRAKEMEIVFGGSVLATPVVLLLARLFRRKAVIQAHGLDVIYPSLFYQLIFARWTRFCDAIIANSKYTARLLIDRGVPQNRISVIPPGVDPEPFGLEEDQSAPGEAPPQGKKTILFVGRLARRKGVREFVQHSLPEIVREIPEAELMIAGDNPRDSLAETDDLKGELLADVSRLKLQANVRFLGGVDDGTLRRLYNGSDVVVLPALSTAFDVEGFGMVLIEAAAAGKPVVATRTGGIPDAVEDGVTGFLVDPGDYSAMNAAIIRLLKDPVLAVHTGRRGRRRVEDHFTWAGIMRRYEAVFETAALGGQLHRSFTQVPDPSEDPTRRR
jgi:phosphatidylinositol alpha-1,6-mannosyltransferase